VGVALDLSTATETNIALAEGIGMMKTKIKLAARLSGILLLLIPASLMLSNPVAAQTPSWLQQLYERQQWQQQEQGRQAYDRQQLLLRQQQERLRQTVIVDVELALSGSYFYLNPLPRSSPRRSSHYKRRTDNGHPGL